MSFQMNNKLINFLLHIKVEINYIFYGLLEISLGARKEITFSKSVNIILE